MKSKAEADEMEGGDEAQGRLDNSTAAADHPAQSAIADGDEVVAPYVPSPDAIAGDKTVAPYMPWSPAPLPKGQKPSQSNRESY